MKTLHSLVIGLAIFAVPAFNFAQAPDYAQFKTDDEANNIEIYKQASPSVVNITNSRLIRSFYSLNPQEVPQGSGTGSDSARTAMRKSPMTRTSTSTARTRAIHLNRCQIK